MKKPPLLSRFLSMFLKDWPGHEVLFHVLFGISGSIEAIRKVRASEEFWEVVAPLIWALSAIVVFHAVGRAWRLTREITEERQSGPGERQSTILAASGQPVTFAVPAGNIPRYYRLKICGMAGLLCVPCFLASYLVWQQSLTEPAPPQLPFALTVFVHSEGNVHDPLLRNSGYVLLDLGPDHRKEPIREKGEAYFSGIPASFRAQEIPIWVESESFESVGTNRTYRLDGSSLYLPVRRKSVSFLGRVQDSDGNSLPGVEIRVAGFSATTDNSGRFELTVPGDHLAEELGLEAVLSGYVSWRGEVVPNSNPIAITLLRASR